MFRRRKIKDEDFKNDPNSEEDFASLWDSDIKVKKKRVRRTKEELKPNYVDPIEMENLIIQYYEKGGKDIPSDLADMIQKIATRLGYAQNFINYCVDEETEALTQRGWLKYNEIELSDKILSYDIKTKNLVWSKIKDIFVGNYDGLMFKLDMKGLDSLVTPNHKFVSLQEGIKPIEYIKTDDEIVLMGNPVKDLKTTYTDEFVELVGWAVTEGNYVYGKRTHCVQIFQKEGLKAQKIRQLLKLVNAKYKEYNWTNPEIKCFRITKDIANNIVKAAKDKILSMEFILELNQQQRLKLIKAMVDGDGHVRKQFSVKGTTNWSYNQKDKKHIDNFIALCTIAGLTTSTKKIKNFSLFSSKSYYTVNIFSEPKLTVRGESINMHGAKPRPGGDYRSKNAKQDGKKQHPNIPTYKYNGKIWCPETEYGTFVCRRGKYVHVTGNSYKEEMIGDAIIKMITALTRKRFKCKSGYNPFSYFTKVAYRAFQNRIKKEKKEHDTIHRYQNEVYSLLTESGQIPVQKNSRFDTEYDDSYRPENI